MKNEWDHMVRKMFLGGMEYVRLKGNGIWSKELRIPILSNSMNQNSQPQIP